MASIDIALCHRTITHVRHFLMFQRAPTSAVPRPPSPPSLSGGPASILPPLQPGQKLLHIVEGWLRQERDARVQKQQQEAAARAASGQQQPSTSVVPSRTPMMPNKHLAFFR